MDEYMNKISIKAQLDVIVRFYGDTDKKLKTEYLQHLYFKKNVLPKIYAMQL